MPSTATTDPPRRLRVPHRIRTLTQLIDAFHIQRNLASTYQKLMQEEERALAELKKREHRIRQRFSKRKQDLEVRRNAIANKTFTYATQNRPALTKRNANTASFSIGTRLVWRTRKISDLPESDKMPYEKARLETFYEEMAALGLEEKYVRIKKEPNRAALADSANEAEVATFTSVSRINRTRFVIDLGTTKLNIAGVIEPDGRVRTWEYVEVDSRSK